MERTVAIDFLTESVARFDYDHAIVAVDVIRATTVMVTALVAGRRCFPAADLDDAMRIAETLTRPLLAGELGGYRPYGFELTNSPAQLAERDDVDRPLILVSTSGTPLLCAAKKATAAYAACLRNASAQVEVLRARHPKVAVVGAGSRGQFRREDQLCCARIATGLIDAGYVPADERTHQVVERWRGAATDAFVGGESTAYLVRVGALEDLEFILAHDDDVDQAFALDGDELVAA